MVISTFTKCQPLINGWHVVIRTITKCQPHMNGWHMAIIYLPHVSHLESSSHSHYIWETPSNLIMTSGYVLYFPTTAATALTISNIASSKSRGHEEILVVSQKGVRCQIKLFLWKIIFKEGAKHNFHWRVTYFQIWWVPIKLDNFEWSKCYAWGIYLCFILWGETISWNFLLFPTAFIHSYNNRGL